MHLLQKSKRLRRLRSKLKENKRKRIENLKWKREKLNSLLQEARELEKIEVIKKEESFKLMMISQKLSIGLNKVQLLQSKIKVNVGLVGHSQLLVLWKEDIRLNLEILILFLNSNWLIALKIKEILVAKVD